MNDTASDASVLPGEDAGRAARYYKREFWIEENRKHIPAHYRLRKLTRIISKVAAGKTTDLLDVGCGPATLRQLLPDNVSYYGIDIAIHEPAPNLLEADIVETPIRFGNMRFRIVVAQGLFEYLGHAQARKFAEVARILSRRGVFIVTFTNFGHSRAHIYEPFNNIQSVEEFRTSLMQYFRVDRSFPISHNWFGGQPRRELMKAVNMRINWNIPFLSPRLAVEYVFICSPRRR
ncbi:MAG: methyltransferase domain-containing protein [Streptosporangiaceae bacterium]